MQFESMNLEQGGAVATLRLSHPREGNPFDGTLRDEMLQALLQLQDSDARALVLVADGPDFSIGLDEAELSGLDHDRMRRRSFPEAGHRIIDILHQLPMPVVASLRGRCAGPAFGLALACEFRIVQADTRLSVGALEYGLFPSWGSSWFLPRILGPGPALGFVLSGAEVDGEAAVARGLANELAVDSDARALAFAAELGKIPRELLRSLKLSFWNSTSYDLTSMLELEAEVGSRCLEERAKAKA